MEFTESREQGFQRGATVTRKTFKGVFIVFPPLKYMRFKGVFLPLKYRRFKGIFQRGATVTRKTSVSQITKICHLYIPPRGPEVEKMKIDENIYSRIFSKIGSFVGA